MIVDTHCHLHFDAYDADRDAAVDRAAAEGVGYFVLVGTDPETNEQAWLCSLRYPGRASHSVGMHPHSAHQAPDRVLKKLEDQARDSKPCAIGEIGLDYFKSEADAHSQKEVFRRMVRLAKANDLPVIIHSRNAFEDTYDLLSEERSGLRGVMHCFSYDEAAMRAMVDLGFYISFAGNISYKSAKALLDVAALTPLDRLVLETDSPYLTPQSRRGQRNEPAYLSETLSILAERRGMPVSVLAEQTTRNAAALFGFPIPS